MTSTTDCYDCSHKHRGYALIFVNEDVKPERIGAIDDENMMEAVLKHLKFEVSHHRSDVMAEEVTQTLDEVLENKANEEYLKDSDCFVFVISTHGTEIPSADGKTYEQQLSCLNNTSITTQDIINRVSKCKALKGKPKLFFIQACRFRDKKDGNTPEGLGRDSGHTIRVTSDNSHDETKDRPKHSAAQLPVGHTKGVSNVEEAIQKLENLDVKSMDSDGDLVDTDASQNSASATTDEASKHPSEKKVEIGSITPHFNPPKDATDASQNSASATAGKASKHPSDKKVEIRPFTPHFILPKDTLIMYAVPPGYLARRCIDGGYWHHSVMLKTLKDVLENIPEDKSLLAGLTEVIGKVARDYEYNPDMTEYEIKDLTEEERRETTLYKSVPVINHRLRYEFYFTKKDD